MITEQEVKPYTEEELNAILEKVYLMRDSYVLNVKKRILFTIQRTFSNAIIKSVLLNKGEIFVSEWTRQHGKTTGVGDTIDFLFEFYFPLCKQLNLIHNDFFNVGFFAPLKQQSQSSFKMLKDGLTAAQRKGFPLSFDIMNGNEIVIAHSTDPDYPKRQAYCFTASPTSHPESKTLSVIVYDEAQDMEDIMIEKAIEPMGASTNATQIYIGVGGYRRCKFWKLLQTLPPENKFICDVHQALKEREELYQLTKNPIYRNYKAHIEKKMRLEGITEDSDHYKTQYLLQWILERGQFITYRALMDLEKEYELYHEYTTPVYVGIDWGKIRDSTVVTVVGEGCQILDWYTFLGDDYNSQLEMIAHLLKEKYKSIKMIHCDATGNQDLGVDNFRALMRSKGIVTQVIGVKFTSQSKDSMFKNLWRLMSPTIINSTVIKPATFSFPKKYDIVKKKSVTQPVHQSVSRSSPTSTKKKSYSVHPISSYDVESITIRKTPYGADFNFDGPSCYFGLQLTDIQIKLLIALVREMEL